jgi:hypothetical protein
MSQQFFLLVAVDRARVSSNFTIHLSMAIQKNAKVVWIGLALLALLAGIGVYANSTVTARFGETEVEEEAESDTGSATGDGVDDFGACDEDADLYCEGFRGPDWAAWAEENGYTSASWKLGLVDCLGQHEEELSLACQDSLNRRAELNNKVNTACAVDRGKYCRGVEPIPGSEPMIDCLKENYEDLSQACADAVDAHEAAKPLDAR